ncbi:MAG: DUF1579 domain-containing protein [Phycisphaerales bacterium]
MRIRKPSFVNVILAGVAVAATAVAIAQQPSKDAKPGAMPPEMKLPPGWTEADMQACGLAGTPGEMHALLMKDVGNWHGKQKMWMAPGTDPVSTECSTKITGLMDGRFVMCEVSGDMPGMGPFKGMGIYGFDNVTQKFQCAWIDNCGTMMATGHGALSSDKKTLTWNYTYSCPITKKPTTLRQVDTITSENGKTSEMFAIDPKSGKEFKMLWTEYTRKN